MAPCSLHAITLLPLMLLTWVAMAMAEAETCFYRQHQSVTINLRQASKRAAGATEARALQSQQACVRACCSTAVKPGGPPGPGPGPGSEPCRSQPGSAVLVSF